MQFSQLTNDEDNLHDDTPVTLSLQDVQDADLDDTMQLIVNGVKPSFKLHEHPNMKKRQKLFLESVNHIRKDVMAHCSFCKERWMDTELSTSLGPGRLRQCNKCWKQSTTVTGIRIYSDANNLDPFPRNDHCNLPKLTEVQKMFISPVHIYMRVYRLEGGGIAYKGQVLNVQQSNMPILNIFPLLPTDLPCVLIRKPGSSSDLTNFKDFTINVPDIMEWLRFLKIHHPMYRNIDLATANERALRLVTMSQENDQGSLLPHLRTMDFDEDDDGEPILTQPVPPTEPRQRELGPETGGASGAQDEPPVTEEFLHIPVDPNGTLTERDTIQNIVNGVSAHPTIPLPWPRQQEFINDFNQPGLLSAAFPTLFPYGVGDPTLRDRIEDVSMTDAMKHLLKYCVALKNDDSSFKEWHYPFAEDDRFVHWAQNTVERHRAQTQRGVLIHQNEELANCSTDEMQEILNEGGQRFESLLSKMQAFNANLNGSPQYLYKQRKSLEAIMENDGMPTLWFTLSMADNHWSDLQSLFHRDARGHRTPWPEHNSEQDRAQWRRRFVRKHPHIVDAFFQQRVDELIKHIFATTGLAVEWHWYRIEYQGRGAPHAHGCLRLKRAPNLIHLSEDVIDGRKASKMLTMRNIDVPNDFTDAEKNFDQWACGEGTDVVLEDVPLSTLSAGAIDKLHAKVKQGRESQATIVTFHDFILTTMHPRPPSDAKNDNRSPNTTFNPKTTEVSHPSSICPLSIFDNQNEKEDLYCRSINAQSRHKHQAYCDRNHSKRQQAKADGKSQEIIDAIPCDCRFDYPKKLSPVTTLEVFERYEQASGGEKLVQTAKIIPQRNDRWLNSHMRSIMDIWGANMDFQLITDAGMVVKYMTKYVTKSEGHLKGAVSRLVKKIFSNVVVEQGRSVQSFIRKSMSKLLSDRLTSKQEKCHLLLGLPIVKSSATTISVDLRNQTKRLDVRNSEGGDNVLELRMSLIDAYAVRMESARWKDLIVYAALGQNQIRSMNMVKFCSIYYVGAQGEGKNKICRKYKTVVPNFFPRPSSNARSKDYPAYCRFALMKYKPWNTTPNNVWGGDLTNDATIVSIWQDYLVLLGDDAPDSLRREIDANKERNDNNNPVYQREGLSNDSVGGAPEPEEDVLCHDDPGIVELLLRRNENNEDEDNNAEIEWDIDHNWMEREVPGIDVTGAQQELNTLRDRTLTRERTVVCKETLNEQQRVAHDMVILACNSTTDYLESINLGNLQIILGQGGCGKSYTIDAIISTLTSEHSWQNENFYVYATTGKAASNINGSTFQNYTDGLGIDSRRAFTDLASVTLQKFQDRMKGKCKLVIIDEYSMLGQSSLYYIDRRLRQIMVTPDIPFGGIVVVLTGDPAQLPPVLANCLWDDRAKHGTPNAQGYFQYLTFTTVSKLTVNERLDRNDRDLADFESFLLRLRDGKLTRDDWERVCQLCSQHSMTPDQWLEHIGNGATHIFFTNKEVNEHNVKCLTDIGKPIVRIEAEHTGRGHTASTTTAGGLDILLFLCIGAKVLLTKNIWQHAGLCNGAVGTVVDIVYDDESIAPGLPVCVLVDFKDDYTGPPIWTPPYSRTIIPIFPVTANWASPTGGGDLVQHSRIMLPLKLSFAWTMWRVQGQTIRSKVVLHLGKTEKEHGLTYTGFSRATKFQNIGIAGGLPLSRLTTKIANQSKMKRRIKEEKKLAKLAAQTRRNVVNNR